MTTSSTAWDTALWRETRAIPDVVRSTLDAAEGFEDLARYLGAATGRIITTGNGAAYYVGMTLWLASLHSAANHAEIVVVPAGVACGPTFGWRHDDTVLVISSSGELRDMVELTSARPDLRLALVTSSPDSTLAGAAHVTARVNVQSQDAATHTQSYAANVAAVLAVWARVSRDSGLAAAIDAAPQACAEAFKRSAEWASDAVGRLGEVSAGVVFGSGSAWPAAMEAALLLKEVARVPVEGMETREGGTTGMYALESRHLVLSLPTGLDALMTEAEDTCRRAGATVLTAPTADIADPRLAALTTFAPAVALATLLAVRAGHDADSPTWTDAYYATARVTSEEQQ